MKIKQEVKPNDTKAAFSSTKCIYKENVLTLGGATSHFTLPTGLCPQCFVFFFPLLVKENSPQNIKRFLDVGTLNYVVISA